MKKLVFGILVFALLLTFPVAVSATESGGESTTPPIEPTVSYSVAINFLEIDTGEELNDSWSRRYDSGTPYDVSDLVPDTIKKGSETQTIYYFVSCDVELTGTHSGSSTVRINAYYSTTNPNTSPDTFDPALVFAGVALTSVITTVIVIKRKGKIKD